MVLEPSSGFQGTQLFILGSTSESCERREPWLWRRPPPSPGADAPPAFCWCSAPPHVCTTMQSLAQTAFSRISSAAPFSCRLECPTVTLGGLHTFSLSFLSCSRRTGCLSSTKLMLSFWEVLTVCFVLLFLFPSNKEHCLCLGSLIFWPQRFYSKCHLVQNDYDWGTRSFMGFSG